MNCKTVSIVVWREVKVSNIIRTGLRNSNLIAMKTVVKLRRTPIECKFIYVGMFILYVLSVVGNTMCYTEERFLYIVERIQERFSSSKWNPRTLVVNKYLLLIVSCRNDFFIIIESSSM